MKVADERRIAENRENTIKTKEKFFKDINLDFLVGIDEIIEKMNLMIENGSTLAQQEEMKNMILFSDKLQKFKEKVDKFVESLNKLNQQYIDRVDLIFNEYIEMQKEKVIQ